MIVAKPEDAVIGRELCLKSTDFRYAQIVKAQIGGQMWLIVSAESGMRASDVRPFGEASAPPCVVLRNRVILRKIERDQPPRS